MPQNQNNPFEYKEPLIEGDGRGVLIDRMKPMKQALQLLQRGGFLTVCAPPRSGVTTFLYSLRKMLPQCVYVDLANLAFVEDPPRQAAIRLASEVALATGSAGGNTGNPVSVTDVLSGFVKMRAANSRAPKSGETLTVIVDGFDAWDDSAARKLVLALRAAYTEARTADSAHCWFSVITGSAVDLRDLTSSGRTSPLNIAQQIFLPDFEESDIVELLMNGLYSAVENGKIADGARNVAYWTGGHPALVQMLGHQGFQLQCDLAGAETWGEILPAAREETRHLLASSLEQLAERQDLQRTVSQIYSGANIPCDRIHRPIRDLIHLGLIRPDPGGMARPRNRLFEEVLANALVLPVRDSSQRIRQTSYILPSPDTPVGIKFDSEGGLDPSAPSYPSAFEWPKAATSAAFRHVAPDASSEKPLAEPVVPGRPDDDAPLVQPGTILGGCRILRRIGRGGMAEVYHARHLGLETDVAIKVMRQLVHEPRMAQRFLREARSAAQLSHENIVQIRNVGREGGVEFIEMEYISGGSLTELLKRAPLKEYSLAVKLLREAAAGIQAAHAKGIIHRDIKPDNLMITQEGRLKVVDFGLVAVASTESGRLTQQGVIVGTPHFMAPEQWEGNTVDERSDIYSLGATFYNLLTGRPPFDGKNAMEVIGNFMAQSVVHPRQFNPDIPAALANAIMRMLEKHAADRYCNIRALLTDPEGLGSKTLV